MKKFIAILLVCSLALAETVISPNMNLPVPVVGTTPGPDWANNINSCMSSIDSHDHTPGHGVQISSESLDISTDFPLNNNSLTEAKSVVFESQSSFSTSKSVYVVSPDLFFRDANGNSIRITQNGSVSGSSGTITGLPSGTASASYQAVGGTFQFQSATNTPANGTFASLSVAQQTTSPNTITIKSPNSLGASYNFTLPTAVPSYTSLLQMSTAGVLSTVPYKVPTIQKFTSGSGTYTLPTGPSPIYIRVRMVGGGGGGGATDTDSGDAGGSTTFGDATAAGGSGGPLADGTPAAGGAGTLGTGAIGTAITGGSGSSVIDTSGAAFGPVGGMGGHAPYFGGGGIGGRATSSGGSNTGGNGVTNTGGGGGGAGAGDSSVGGSGGGSGGFVEQIITSPSGTYSYAVGAGGAGGNGTQDGGNGAAGYIEVLEIYQ